ncbi:MAG: hypothetical protein P4L49_20980 [Desulfosporosinus sp.]|nr:hypothetical protein [Desulfosporosinus sp.]
MRFKNKTVIFILIIIVSLLAGLVGCGQTQQNMAGSSPDSPVPLNKEESSLTFVRMVDAKIGWASTKESILRTVDGGENWTDVTPQRQSGLSVSSLFCRDGQNAVLALTQESSPQIIVCWTTDSGRNWGKSEINTSSNIPAGEKPVKLSFSDAEHGWLLAGYGVAMGSEFDELFQTTDGGTTWKSIASSSPDPQSANGLPFAGIKTGFVFSDRQNGWLTGYSHGDGIWLYTTADGGVSWTPQNLAVPFGYHAEGGSANSNQPWFFQAQTGLLPVELRGQTPPALVFYLTQNDGKSWQATTPVRSSQEPFRGFQTNIVDARHAFVSDGYELFYSADGMRSFTSVKPNIDFTNLSQLDFISEQIGWGIIDGRLWKTTDGGYVWTQMVNQSLNLNQTAIENSLNLKATVLKKRGDLTFTWQGLLYLLYGDTGELKQLTNSDQAYYPAWSFDGEWISFLLSDGQDENNGRLWLVRRDGQQAHPVQGLPELPNVPNTSWSPTANVLITQGQDGLWLVPVEGNPYRIQGTGKYTSYACWSPDGKFLAYNSSPVLSQDSKLSQERQDTLNTFNLETGQTVRQLISPAETGIIVAAWWPDCKGLLYWLDPAFSASFAADGLELQSLKLGDSQPKALTYGLVYRDWLSFLPNGQLLMVAGGNRTVWSEKSLAICDPGTGSTRKLANPKGAVAIDPAPSPDGSKIAFIIAQNLDNATGGLSDPGNLSNWAATRILWIENADGSGAHPLKAAGTGIYQPEWSKDGTRIMYVQDNSLWMIGADGNNPQKIIGSFPDWEKDPFGYYGYIYHNDVAWFQP